MKNNKSKTYPEQSRRIKIIFSVILLFDVFGMAPYQFATGQAKSSEAAEYYVSPAGSGTTCSNASPCPMLYGVNTKAVAGDTVIFKTGTYNRTNELAPGYLLYITHGGTDGNLITLKSETKYGAILDGENNDECVAFNKYASYIRIENFEIKNCTVGIISSDTPGASNIYIYGNHIHNLTHHGIDFVSGSNYWTIDSNIIHDLDPTPVNPTWHPYGIYAAYDVSNTTIVNNVFYNIKNGYHIHIYAHGDPDPQQNTKIVNNTFADESLEYTGQIIIAAVSPNLLIENNIFYNPTTAAIRAVYYGNIGQGIIIRNNLTNSSLICTGTDCGNLTFANNITSSDPNFFDSLNHNYHLFSNSPAINTGLATNAPSADFDNNTRPQGSAYDIGAYEYISASDTTPPSAPSGLSVN
ncbi:MAG: choice-of-anchor Q domain-containing protein [Parcubacteria group bacterium]